MNDDQLNDLKQFIAATVSQSTAHLATKDDLNSVKSDLGSVKGDLSELKTDLKRLEQKVDDGFAGIGDAIEDLHKQQSDTDQRVTKLEQQAV